SGSQLLNGSLRTPRTSRASGGIRNQQLLARPRPGGLGLPAQPLVQPGGSERRRRLPAEAVGPAFGGRLQSQPQSACGTPSPRPSSSFAERWRRRLAFEMVGLLPEAAVRGHVQRVQSTGLLV
uniref:Tumor protein p53-inducible protein 11 n=1 Tax=Macrostomum lignano TaxID=282301 RepID=A0A1I8FCZ6_9PLAT